MFRNLSLVILICCIAISFSLFSFGDESTSTEKENSTVLELRSELSKLKAENARLKKTLELFNNAIPESATREILLRGTAGDLSLINEIVEVEGTVGYVGKESKEYTFGKGYYTNLGIQGLSKELLFASPIKFDEGTHLTVKLQILEIDHIQDDMDSALIDIVKIHLNQRMIKPNISSPGIVAGYVVEVVGRQTARVDDKLRIVSADVKMESGKKIHIVFSNPPTTGMIQLFDKIKIRQVGEKWKFIEHVSSPD